jgi:hypothetical protein
MIPAAPRGVTDVVSNSLRTWTAGYPLASHSFYYEELARQIRSATGCEGLAVVHGKHLMIANEATEFAHHVIRLLGSRTCAATLLLRLANWSKRDTIGRRSAGSCWKSIVMFLSGEPAKKAPFRQCLAVFG